MRRDTVARALPVALTLVLVVTGIWTVPLAGQRALAAEEEYVADRLSGASCLADWGVNEGAGPSRDASIRGLSASGVRVHVTVPYATETVVDNSTVYGDTASEAVYLVTPLSTRRVEGDDLPAC
jgi:hypothetical protein